MAFWGWCRMGFSPLLSGLIRRGKAFHAQLLPAVWLKMTNLGLCQVPLYYYYSYSFADAISPELIERIVGKRVRSTNGHANGYKGRTEARPHLLGLGSILNHARSRDIVWGTGMNITWARKRPSEFRLDIRAVRGPLTREYVIDELGLDCPEVYGDPALLFPRYFPEFQRSPEKEYIVIVQHKDEGFIRKNWSEFSTHNVFLCQRPPNRMPWQQVVKEILTSNFVISSSLHALIFAEVYGIPARWWHSEDLPSIRTEGTFKYNDYFASTGRSLNDFAVSIEEALQMGGKEPIREFDFDKLNDAFPYELFHARWCLSRNWQ